MSRSHRVPARARCQRAVCGRGRRRSWIGLVGLALVAALAAGCRSAESPRAAAPAAAQRFEPKREAHWHNNRGVAFLEEGRLPEAEEEFRQALKAIPDLPVAVVNVSLAEALQGRGEPASKRLLEASGTLPSDVSLHAVYLGGWLAEQEQNYQQALSGYASVVLSAPSDMDVVLRAARARLHVGEYESLTELVLPAFLEREPSVPELYDIMAQALEALDESQRAAGYRQQAQALRQRYRPRPVLSPLDRLGPLGQPLHVAEPFATVGARQRQVRFSEAAAGAGIGFRHGGGISARVAALWRGEALPVGDWDAVARWELAAALGSGATFGDLDGDGDLDLYVANAGPTPDRCRNALYVNQGNGTFVDRTEQAGVGGDRPSLSCVAGDVDGDGHLDLYVANAGPNDLYLNQGDGTFREVAEPWGVAGNSFDTGAALGDLDDDGDLDLYVCGYLDLNARPAGPRFTETELAGHPNRLYLNQGDHFREAAQSMGVDGGKAHSLSVTIIDIDNDQDLDLLIANRGAPPFVFSNQQGLPFIDRAEATFRGTTAFQAMVEGDFTQDGFPDLYLVGAAGEKGQLAVNRRNQSFERTFRLPPGNAGSAMGAGALFVDVDGDGDLDLLLGQAVSDSGQDPSSARLHVLQNNMGLFTDITDAAGLGSLPASDARGLTAGDYDGDGDLDVALVTSGGALLLLRSDTSPPPRWLKVRLIGHDSPRHGVGARVEVKSGTYWQVQLVGAGSGFLSAAPPERFFSLGDLEALDFVRVRWPSGRRQALVDVETNQVLTLEEPQD